MANSQNSRIPATPWCNIKRGTKEYIEKYTTRYVQSQSELEDTTKTINTSVLVRKWRQGNGKQMNQINTTIDDLCVDLLKILSTGNDSKSGVSILLNLESKIRIPKSIDTIDNLYVRWCNIKRGTKEFIEKYTTRCVQSQSELEDVIKAINTSELVRKWRQGIGKHMNQIDTTIDELCVDLPQWSDTLPMYHFMDQAIQYFVKVSNAQTNTTQMSNNNENKHQNNYNTTNATTNNNNNNNNARDNTHDNNNKVHSQRDNLPQGFSNLENRKSYIKKVVGTYSFIKDTNLESSVKFVQGFRNGCYVCRINNHICHDCVYLNSWKRLSKAAYDLEVEASQKNTTKQLDKNEINTKINNTKNISTNRVTADIPDIQEHYQQVETDDIENNNINDTLTFYLVLACSVDINRISINY